MSWLRLQQISLNIRTHTPLGCAMPMSTKMTSNCIVPSKSPFLAHLAKFWRKIRAHWNALDSKKSHLLPDAFFVQIPWKAILSIWIPRGSGRGKGEGRGGDRSTRHWKAAELRLCCLTVIWLRSFQFHVAFLCLREFLAESGRSA